MLYYAAKIFKDAGFASDADATRVSVVLGFFKLVMTGELHACHDIMYMAQSCLAIMKLYMCVCYDGEVYMLLVCCIMLQDLQGCGVCLRR